jgi:hypothetical protein
VIGRQLLEEPVGSKDFTDSKSKATVVDKTFGYVRDEEGRLLHFNNIDRRADEKLTNKNRGPLSPHIFHCSKLLVEVRDKFTSKTPSGILVSTEVMPILPVSEGRVPVSVTTNSRLSKTGIWLRGDANMRVAGRRSTRFVSKLTEIRLFSR